MRGSKISLKNLPIDFFKENYILPSDEDTVYITEKTPFFVIEDIRFLIGKTPKTVLITEDEFLEKLEDFLTKTEGNIEEDKSEEEQIFENLLESSSSPVVQSINSIFLKAIRNNVSDIHFEPFTNKVIVRFRLDGVLHEISEFQKSVYPQIVSRIKILAKLNVAEKRLPQDGRIRVKIGKRDVDMRVSTLPTIFGERVVIRLLDKTNRILTLEELGFSSEDKEKYERIIKKPYGIIIITGPTGSGKTTTLYASLLKLKTPRKNILTIEDPVEYQIDGISQIQVNPKIDLTFANGLRSILRQDPDIIMVGEIRDLETAKISIHASMTGHLVLSTLHTNDAPSTVARLVDMGIEPFLIASSLEGVIAQRLVRKVCKNCKTSIKLTDLEIEQIIHNYKIFLARKGLKEKNFNYFKNLSKITDNLKETLEDIINYNWNNRILNEYKKDYKEYLKSINIYKGLGCDECLGTGYKGRIAIYEIMEIDEDLRALISKNVETSVLRDKAIKKGMKTLVQDGIEKVLTGITTLEEVLQVAQV